MKLTLANNNRAFTRTQWLLTICLSVVAFEFGARYAEKQKDPPPPAVVRSTNIVVTNLWMTEDGEELVPVVLETNLPNTNIAGVRIRYAPPKKKYTPPPAGEPGQMGQIHILKGDGSVVVRRVKLPPPVILPNGETAYGVRVVVP